MAVPAAKRMKVRLAGTRRAGLLAGHAGIRAGIPDQPDTSPA
ncbi:MAG TPA: hypothetical protein VMA31_07360 [Bryobacteraceae bacterium]|nr:hypothetical protein [Bryobacteraceae bacterium]